MAFGGLLDVLDTPVLIDNGWDGGTLSMTHRAYVVVVSVMPDGGERAPLTTSDPVVCTVRAYLGKVANNQFVAYPNQTPLTATFTRTEVSGLPSITIAAIIVAAKGKLGL